MLGIGWVVAAAAVVMTPALVHGIYLGPYAWLTQFGLSQNPGPVPHDLLVGDQITQMIPWATQAWTQVHQGHLPLWNPYSALGTPLAFNWQSATFSVPALFGYLFPLSLAYTVQVLTTFVIAGSGVYVLGRVLRCGVLASAFAATMFELSGAFMLYSGWPIAAVMSWAGWLLAATVLVIRGGRRARNVAFFALTLALAIYAGQPDALVILGLGLAIFVVVCLATRAISVSAPGPVLRPLADLAIGAVAGAALGTPLLLPGYQVARQSVRSVGGGALGGDTAIRFSLFGHLGGLNGPRLTGDPALVSVIAVTLAVVAIGLRWRQPEVLAFAAIGVVMGAASFVQPVITFLVSVPGLGPVRWTRAVLLLALAISVLGGLGMDLLIRSPQRRSVLKWAGSGFVVDAALLLIVTVGGGQHLSHVEASDRVVGLIWAAVETALGLVGIGALALTCRRDVNHDGRNTHRAARWVGGSFLACATACLAVFGGPLWPSSPSFITVTPAEGVLEHAVGRSLVGMGASECLLAPGLGIRVNVNVMFGVRELAVYDPMLSRRTSRGWRRGIAGPQSSRMPLGFRHSARR